MVTSITAEDLKKPEELKGKKVHLYYPAPADCGIWVKANDVLPPDKVGEKALKNGVKRTVHFKIKCDKGDKSIHTVFKNTRVSYF